MCYLNTDTFVVHIKTEDIAEAAKSRFDTLDYELDRTLPNGKKVIGLIEDELSGKIVTKVVALGAKIIVT